jgi:hypothetical protein
MIKVAIKMQLIYNVTFHQGHALFNLTGLTGGIPYPFIAQNLKLSELS